jgi:hypothetical protein
MTYFANWVHHYTGKRRHGVAAGLFTLIFLLLAAFPVYGQETPPVIGTENITRLQPVERINFADLPADAGRVESGWFAVSADGRQYALLNRDNGIVLWDFAQGGDVTTSLEACGDQPGAFVDGSFDRDGRYFIAVYLAGADSYIVYHAPDESRSAAPTICDLPASPLRVWPGESGRAWLEFFPNDPLFAPSVGLLTPGAAWDAAALIPSGPENDAESFIRIGRIEPPLAITVTRDSLVKRWNLQTGAVTAAAQLDILPGIGQVNYGDNEAGRYFAWVDGPAAALNMLDFETGANRSITSLNGKSVPFLWLTPGADIVIGVNVESKSAVTAWDTATGQRYDLGEYRPCSRPPDMVRLSRNGTTLVIGCDTGLDIWRVGENQ